MNLSNNQFIVYMKDPEIIAESESINVISSPRCCFFVYFETETNDANKKTFKDLPEDFAADRINRIAGKGKGFFSKLWDSVWDASVGTCYFNLSSRLGKYVYAEKWHHIPKEGADYSKSTPSLSIEGELMEKKENRPDEPWPRL